MPLLGPQPLVRSGVQLGPAQLGTLGVQLGLLNLLGSLQLLLGSSAQLGTLSVQLGLLNHSSHLLYPAALVAGSQSI